MNNRVGKFISLLRKEKGLTQKELSNKLFVTDKAVSKWERGLSLPDITLLQKLADILDVSVVELLEGKRGIIKKVDIEKEVSKIEKQLKKNYTKKVIKISLIAVFLLLVIGYLLFRNIYLGYDLEIISFVDRKVPIGVPKASFSMKQNDRSYSYKTFRNANIVEKEQKDYLKTLKYVTCKNTIYYYDEQNDFSIIDYSVKNHGLYSTISYQLNDYDYCYRQRIEEYSKKMNGLLRYHLSYDNQYKNGILDIAFRDNLNHSSNEFTAVFSIYYYELDSLNKKEKKLVLEESSGTFDIRDDKLYYYRNEISNKGDNIEIPEVSTFQLEDGKMILLDNYLSEYRGEIILE